MKRPEVPTGATSGLLAARTLSRWTLVALLLAYAASGVTIVAPGEVGLVRRLGRWRIEAVAVEVNRPGILFAWPVPFEEVTRLSIKQEVLVDIPVFVREPSEERAESVDEECCLLTGDQNAVSVQARVKYRIARPDWFATATQEPALTISHVATAALTVTLNSWTVDEVLQRRRLTPGFLFQTLSEEVLSKMQRRLDSLRAGVELTALEIRSVQPPAGVREAFLAVQARVDQDALREEAAGERAESLLTAETMARQFVADAKGRLSSHMSQATREVALFEAALAACRGPEGRETARRLKRETWEQILSTRGRVFVLPGRGSPGGIRLTVPETEARR